MRIQGWQTRLTHYLYSVQEIYLATGLEYGTLDCCTFTANWVQILTGEDPMAEYRGEYSTAEEAFTLLKEREGSFYRALQKRFGNPVHPSKAQRGDIAYRKDDKALGIYFTSGGRMMALFLADGGFTLHRAKDIDYAFQVR